MGKRNNIIMLFVLTFFLFLSVHFHTKDKLIKTTADTHHQTIPLIYVVTPTYSRLSQIPDLTRLANTLSHVHSLHWIVIEDAYRESKEVRSLLNESMITFSYLTTATPREKVHNKYLKGILQRNAGISWIREHHNRTQEAVVYFADDDNTYSLSIFDEMRMTRKISIWPVGFAGQRIIETPKVENGKVIGFSAWQSDREFAVDMAGFALNVKVLFDYPDMIFPLDTESSFQETEFLEQCCKREELEPLADNCTKVLVWHTKTQKPPMSYVKIEEVKHLIKFYHNS